jgi:hypothetical protein
VGGVITSSLAGEAGLEARVDHLPQSGCGLTSAPLRPQMLQTKRGSTSLSRTSRAIRRRPVVGHGLVAGKASLDAAVTRPLGTARLRHRVGTGPALRCRRLHERGPCFAYC